MNNTIHSPQKTVQTWLLVLAVAAASWSALAWAQGTKSAPTNNNKTTTSPAMAPAKAKAAPPVAKSLDDAVESAGRQGTPNLPAVSDPAVAKPALPPTVTPPLSSGKVPTSPAAALDPKEKPASELARHPSVRKQGLMAGITIFILAIFVGFDVINKVPTTLHTPLMSGSNAISGITVVGALIAAGKGHQTFASFLGFFAVALAMINVVGGFLVTHRMLLMFKRK